MAYKIKSMLKKTSDDKKSKSGSTYSKAGSNEKTDVNFEKNYNNIAGENRLSNENSNNSNTTTPLDYGLGGIIAAAISRIGSKSMSGFDKEIKKANKQGKLKKAARLEKKQAAFQRRQERGSARYAERKGTEPIYSTDKENLLPNREDTFLDIRKNRVSNKERKEQIARRVKENRAKRIGESNPSKEKGNIILTHTAKESQENVVSKDLTKKSPFVNFNPIAKDNLFPSTFPDMPMMGDGFNKGMSRKNKYKK